MADVLSETRLDLKEAAKLLPGSGRGKCLHWVSVLRYATSGRLEAVRVGGRWWTSREAVARMLERDTLAGRRRPAPTPATAAARSRANERAKAELRKMGVLA